MLGALVLGALVLGALVLGALVGSVSSASNPYVFQKSFCGTSVVGSSSSTTLAGPFEFSQISVILPSSNSWCAVEFPFLLDSNALVDAFQAIALSIELFKLVKSNDKLLLELIVGSALVPIFEPILELIMGPAVVGPAVVGPAVVGPAVVEPILELIMGPAVVGAAVGAAVVGPDVGAAVVGAAVVGADIFCVCTSS